MPKNKKNSGIYGFFRGVMFRTLYNPASKVKDVTQVNQDFYKLRDGKVNLIFDLDAHAWAIGSNREAEEADNSILIDAVMLTNNTQQLYDPKKMYIIVVEDGLYELNNFSVQPLVNDGTANIISFNPIGMGFSSGTPHGPEDYKIVLQSIIKNLHSSGIPNANIVLVGNSLPGAMATIVAEECRDAGQKIGLVLKEENAPLKDVYFAFTPWPLRILYRYLSSWFALDVDATKSFENLAAAENPHAKIIPEAEINGHLTQLHQDRKNTLEQLNEQSKKLEVKSLQILENSINLINTLQKNSNLEELSKKYFNSDIRKLSEELKAKNIEYKKIIKETTKLRSEASDQAIISKDTSVHIKNLLTLSEDLEQQQQNIENVLLQYKTAGQFASDILKMNKRLDNIQNNGNYNIQDKQEKAINDNLERSVTTLQLFRAQIEAMDQTIENTKNRLETIIKSTTLKI